MSYDLTGKSVSQLVEIYNAAAWKAKVSSVKGFRTGAAAIEKTTTVLDALNDPETALAIIADPSAFPNAESPDKTDPKNGKASKASKEAKEPKSHKAKGKPTTDAASQPEATGEAATKAPKERKNREPSGPPADGDYTPGKVRWLRPNSVKAKLFAVLHSNLGKPVPIVDAQKAVYAVADKTVAQALQMSLLGIKRSIKDENLPFAVEKLKTDEGVRCLMLKPVDA